VDIGQTATVHTLPCPNVPVTRSWVYCYVCASISSQASRGRTWIDLSPKGGTEDSAWAGRVVHCLCHTSLPPHCHIFSLSSFAPLHPKVRAIHVHVGQKSMLAVSSTYLPNTKYRKTLPVGTYRGACTPRCQNLPPESGATCISDATCRHCSGAYSPYSGGLQRPISICTEVELRSLTCIGIRGRHRGISGHFTLLGHLCTVVASGTALLDCLRSAELRQRSQSGGSQTSSATLHAVPLVPVRVCHCRCPSVRPGESRPL
jgi:hypothetical protein